MSHMPAVVVRKGGFLAALFHGLFGFLTVVVICATGLGVYALHVADGKVGGLLDVGKSIISGLPDWQKSLPPVLAEALDDRRAPDYWPQLDVSVETAASSDRPDREVTIVEVQNHGPETITLLALSIVLEDENGIPTREVRTYAATPFAFDEDDWRGPLWPGQTRRFVVCNRGQRRGVSPTIQPADLRVWNGPRARDETRSSATEAQDDALTAADSR